MSMTCPSCGHPNPADARFCERCGTGLRPRCPKCGLEVTAGAPFCRHCGADLSRAGGAPGGSADIAPQAAPEVEGGRKRIRGERKQITAVFVDIVGSTFMAEKMDPEDWREIVDGAHRRVIQAVKRYDGTIAQLLGDGVLAFFGAPQAHEDDPERAIRAALAIQEQVREYAEEIRARVGGFQVRVGIHSGPVVVGDVGDDLHLEYLAVGDTVNLAARIQGAAEPGTVLISSETHRLAGPVFETQDRGRIELKGKGEPVHVYGVSGARSGALRPRGIEGMFSPLVGRDQELARLESLLASLGEGRGRAVAVIGEAGLGKSRLIAEWRKAAVSKGPAGLRWVEARCLSFSGSLAYHLAGEMLRGALGAGPEVGPEATQATLKTACGRLGLEGEGEVFPALARLLGLSIDDESSGKIRFLDGAALHAKYAIAARELLTALAAEQPLVIVCEDIHWADPSSVELALQVIPEVVKGPVVVALVSRPDEGSPGWRLIEHARSLPGALEVSLSPLTALQSGELIEHLLRAGHLPEGLRPMVLDRAEGNPFFVEEVLRMLIDRGAITATEGGWELAGALTPGEIPDTLQGVLAARIDRLTPEAKRVLQVAAVLGRQFSASLLENTLNSLGASDEIG